MFDTSLLASLFSRDAFMAHGICLVWRPELLWLHGLSDLLTALAYYSIPFALAVFAWKRRDLKFRWMFLLFGAFILACGTTHLMALWTLWVPDYGAQGVVKAVTAAVSVATAVLLWPLIPRALALPGPSHLEAINARLRGEVAEREAVERKVRSLNRDLERRVTDRTAELSRANAQLAALNRDLRTEIETRKRIEADLRQAKERAEEADRGKSRFMAAASHDLRQPVQALVFLIEAVARRQSGAPEVAGLLDHMRSSVDGLQRLLDSLLDLSRLDAGAIEAHPRPVPLGELLARLTKEYLPLAEAKGLHLRHVPTSALGETDPALLERIVRNLIENALRYTGTGGIVVGCRRRGRGKGGQVTVEVADSGVGVPEDQRDAIFQEFYQVGNPERDRRKGLGLGLSIVRRLAAILGHAVAVTSRPGHGSRFSVTLPSAEAPHAPPSADAPPQSPLAPLPRTVLVIDDEPTVLMGIGAMLRDWGCETLLAADEDAALALVSTHGCPGAVVADYRLREGRTGIAAVTRLRAVCGPALPAALLTGDNGEDIAALAAAAGMTLLTKPVAAPALKLTLSRLGQAAE